MGMSCRGVWQCSDLGEKIHLEEAGMELDDYETTLAAQAAISSTGCTHFPNQSLSMARC